MSACTCTTALDLDCPVHREAVADLVVQAIDAGRVIQAQPPGRCELCDAVKETRPYGPNGEEVCFPCATATPEAEAAAKKAFMGRFDRDTEAGR